MPPSARPVTIVWMSFDQSMASPRYDFLTRSSSRSSALAPSITTRPTSSTYARFVEASAMPAFCSTTSTVSPISCVSAETSS